MKPIDPDIVIELEDRICHAFKA